MASTATSPPPSSLPSPSVSNSHTGLSMSALSAPNGAPRAPSTASHLSHDGRDGPDSRAGAYPNGGMTNDFPQHAYRPHHDDATPQPNLYQQPSYLPPVTTSPPPHAPTYIPPPQHAMAPDPIHGMMPVPGAINPGFPTGGYPPHYRAGPGSYGPGYRLPNGHTPPIPGPEGFLPSRHPIGPSGPMANQALLQQAILMSGGGGRPGSASGSRERRPRERSHHREDDGDRDSREEEVISTIFVVGFPDDMSEREFQNIFTFAPGFEAATLKFPSGSARSREPTAALLAELTQLAASQQAAAAQQAAANGEPADFPLQTPLEEAIAALQLSSTTSSSTTPSAAVSLTPSVPPGPFTQGLPQLPTRRQTIGFARFKTRADALAARENLQGKKIDPMTGATLKAEMAKKNLHTKRNNPNDDLVGMLLRSGRLAGLVNHGPTNQPPLPPPHVMGPPGVGGLVQHTPGRDNWDWQGAEEKYSHQPQSAAYSGPIPPSTVHPSQPTHPSNAQSSLQSNGSTTSASPPQTMTSPSARPTDSKALLALAADADELDEWSAIEGMTMSIEGLGSRSAEDSTPRHDRERSGNASATYPVAAPGPNPAIPISTSAPSGNTDTNSVAAQTGSSSLPMNVHSPTLSNSNMYRPGYGPNSAGALSPHASLDGFASSPPAVAGEHMEGGRPVGGIGAASNPADQNPPINTLYVGNLPAISPPTHPPNFLEEALRSLFCRFPGYKRMSFRQKINGPMCFVEFEDVNYAAQAIKDLYGHTLAGIVKGGIRLSYSKNSLGQRGSAHPAGTSTSLFGGIAHTVALAGMSSPSSQNGNYANGNGAGAHSAPIPMPSDVRRGSEVSGLSPTAQPFNAPLPITHSPRSRFFGSSPPQNGPTISTAQPIPQAPSSQSGSFSPVSSPIRTPASFSWVSSGSAGIGGVGNGGYGFEPFSPHSNGGGLSLSGAASAWQQGNGSRRTPT